MEQSSDWLIWIPNFSQWSGLCASLVLNLNNIPWYWCIGSIYAFSSAVQKWTCVLVWAGCLLKAVARAEYVLLKLVSSPVATIFFHLVRIILHLLLTKAASWCVVQTTYAWIFSESLMMKNLNSIPCSVVFLSWSWDLPMGRLLVFIFESLKRVQGLKRDSWGCGSKIYVTSLFLKELHWCSIACVLHVLWLCKVVYLWNKRKMFNVVVEILHFLVSSLGCHL